MHATIIIIEVFFTRVVVTIIAVTSFFTALLSWYKRYTDVGVGSWDDIAFEENKNGGVWFAVFVIFTKKK